MAAAGRAPQIPESADAYGWLVGSWDLDVRRYWGLDVTAQRIKGEIHFGWVLEGRAVQDVWIMPRRPDRTGDVDKTRNMYGTTLRAWDPTIQAWRITWVNPPATTTSSRSAGGSARTSCKSALAPTAPSPDGRSPRSPPTRSAGSARRWSRTARRGGWRASFAPPAHRGPAADRAPARRRARGAGSSAATATGQVIFDDDVLVDGIATHPTRPAPFIRTDIEK